MTGPGIFGPPALPRMADRWPVTPPASGRRGGHIKAPSRPHVSASATGSFRMGPGARVVTVDVLVDGVVFSCLVRADRVVTPTMRGEIAVRFTDPGLDAKVHRAAVDAARDAELAGWLL